MADDEAPKNNATMIAPSSDEQQVVVAITTTDVAKVEEKERVDNDDELTTAKDEAKEEVSVETKNVVDDDAEAEEKEEEEEDKEEVTSGVTVADAVVENTNNNNVSEITSENNELYPENERKALSELKDLIRTALNKHEFVAPPASPPPPPAKEEAEAEVEKTAEEEKEDAMVPTVAIGEEAAKVVSVNEDGTKTVEAIEETVVSSVPALGKEQTKPIESSSLVSSALESSSPLADANHQQEVKTTTKEPEAEAAPLLAPEEVSIWGVPLLKDERTDTILWKFLRARDFKVHDAFAMLKSTIKWRNDFKIEELLNEDLGDDLEKAVFMHGVSKEGHPVCYNVYGAFQDKGLYQKTFSDEQKRLKFLKWRIQFLEKSIRKLDFWPNGISTIVQVNDLKNSPGPAKTELRQATKQALHLLQDNYPEFVAKQVFVNVPWWYVAVNKMISPFLTQRTKSKFVVAGPSKSAETLFSYIAPEQVPVQYGGLSKQGEFGAKDGVTQIIVKPNSKENVEFAVTEACHLTWEVRVLGWEVSYGAEFVPNAKDAYTVIIQKMKKVGPTEETIISNTFKTCEPGKVVLTIDNSSSKKKRLLYSLKSKSSLD